MDAVESIVAEGLLSLPVRRLAELVADSRSFRLAVGAATPADALKTRIHHPHVRMQLEDNQIALPLAVITRSRFRLRRVATYMMRPEDCALDLILRDWDQVPERTDHGQLRFDNWCGNVISEIAELQGRDGRMAIDSISAAEPSKVSSLKTLGDGQPFWSAAFEIVWSRG
jgi:hypothetical protein